MLCAGGDLANTVQATEWRRGCVQHLVSARRTLQHAGSNQPQKYRLTTSWRQMQDSRLAAGADADLAEGPLQHSMRSARDQEEAASPVDLADSPAEGVLVLPVQRRQWHPCMQTVHCVGMSPWRYNPMHTVHCGWPVTNEDELDAKFGFRPLFVITTLRVGWKDSTTFGFGSKAESGLALADLRPEGIWSRHCLVSGQVITSTV